MSTPGPVDPTPDDDAGERDAIASAKAALDAARESVAALVTVRAKAIQEAARLRQRAQAPGREELTDSAALHEARATDLEARIAQLRDLAHRAEVAYEALRADHAAAEGEEPPTPGEPSDGISGTG